MYGYQSGGFKYNQDNVDHDVSNSYASSMFYDQQSRSAYVVGSTYWSYWDRHIHTDEEVNNLAELDESDCFFAILSAPSQDDDLMHLDYSRRFGKSDVSESCTSISFSRQGGTMKILTAGHTEETGMLTSLRSLGNPTSAVYGFMLDLDFGGNSFGRLNGGHLMSDTIVQYPVAITTNPNPLETNNEAVYAVSLSSLVENKNQIPSGNDPRPDKAIGGVDLPEYGSHYSVFIKKMYPKTQEELEFDDNEADFFNLSNSEGGLKETFRKGWTKLLSPDISLKSISMEHYLQVGDLKYVPREQNDSLVLVGTTSGYGEAFGGKIDNELDDESFRYKAGFITVLDINGTIEATTRIQIDEEDVVIKGVCLEEGSENVDFLYVVGETRGLLADDMRIQDLSKDAGGRHSKHVFLTKVDITNLSRVWTRQLGGTLGKDVVTEGCAVSPGGDVVYMGGTVTNGDKIRLRTGINEASAGGDDIFVANYNAMTGAQTYVKQIGSSRDDWLAKGNGITTDEAGNALVLGNSQGSMMRWRGEADVGTSTTFSRELPSDIFIFSISKVTGSTKTIAEKSKDDGTVVDDPASDSGSLFSSFGPDAIAMIIAVCTLVVSAYFVGYKVIISKTMFRKDDSDSVVSYLEEFRDNAGYEVHIRNSTTGGGVHAIYGNKNILDLQSSQNTPSTTSNSRSNSTSFGLNSSSNSSSIDFEIDEVTRETMNLSKSRKIRPNSARSLASSKDMSYDTPVIRGSRKIPPGGAFSIASSSVSASVFSYDDSSGIQDDDMSWGNDIL